MEPMRRGALMLLSVCAVCGLVAAAHGAAPAFPGNDLSALLSAVQWGETSTALVAHFGRQATVVEPPIDFGDSYVNVLLRDVSLGGVRLIAFFEMDKHSGGLKRIQIERPRHGVNPPAFRAVGHALEARYGAPDGVCNAGTGPLSGYQAAAVGFWQRGGVVIRAVFRDTTIEAVEGCLSGDLTAGSCGLAGQMLVRISPPDGGGAGCAGPPSAAR